MRAGAVGAAPGVRPVPQPGCAGGRAQKVRLSPSASHLAQPRVLLSCLQYCCAAESVRSGVVPISVATSCCPALCVLTNNAYMQHGRVSSLGIIVRCCRYVQTRMWLWAALAGMLGLQQQPAMVTVLQAFPQLADIVVNHALSTSSHQ